MPEHEAKPIRTGEIGPAAAARVMAALTEDGGDAGAGVGLGRIDGYILTRKLGEGGGGVVYQGHREGSDRALAVKLLNRRVGRDDAAGKRAWRELDLLMQLRLPALPRVIDYGWHDGRLYIATEFVDGLPLDRYCEEKKLDRRARVELLARVADAVQSLHEQGVIHRDLKPSNILVDSHGQPFIIDLGIATLLAADVMETLTADGAPIGSPAFMAPEQARGEREKISTRTDVYGLGATAYLLLTGKTPHDVNTTIHEAVRRVAQDPARRARELEPGLPRPLAAVVEKAAAGRGEERYTSAGELAADLRRWLDGESVLATDAGVWRRCIRWLGRHPLLATAAASCLLAVCIVGAAIVAVWWAGTRAGSIRIDSDDRCRWAEIRSYAGWPIRRWEAGVSSTIVYAGQFERPREFGGGRVFLVTPAAESGDPYAERLCAYAARDPWHPIWTSGIGPPDINMPTLEGFTAPRRFVCSAVAFADIFPESPGSEIIVILRHTTWGPTVVRIYDAGGHVLFEAWHNGWIETAAWLPDPGVLVLSGMNSEVKWEGRGFAGLRNPFPSVVMAIRPELGRKAGWIRTPTAPGDLDPAWYKCVLPPEAVDLLTADHGNDPNLLGHAENSGTTIGFRVGYVAMMLDGSGREVGQRHVDAKYDPSGTMPDPNTYPHLGDLPPIDPARAVSARPANNY